MTHCPRSPFASQEQFQLNLRAAALRNALPCSHQICDSGVTRPRPSPRSLTRGGGHGPGCQEHRLQGEAGSAPGGQVYFTVGLLGNPREGSAGLPGCPATGEPGWGGEGTRETGRERWAGKAEEQRFKTTKAGQLKGQKQGHHQMPPLRTSGCMLLWVLSERLEAGSSVSAVPRPT